MFYWLAKNSKFPADKWRFDNTDPHCSVPLSNSSIFVDLLQIKDKFHCQDSIIIPGVSAYERTKTKGKNPIFILKSVRVRLRESVRLWECVNTEFDWEVKRGFEKVSVSRVVRLRGVR